MQSASKGPGVASCAQRRRHRRREPRCPSRRGSVVLPLPQGRRRRPGRRAGPRWSATLLRRHPRLLPALLRRMRRSAACRQVLSLNSATPRPNSHAFKKAQSCMPSSISDAPVWEPLRVSPGTAVLDADVDHSHFPGIRVRHKGRPSWTQMSITATSQASELDMSNSDAWEVAVIDICVQDGRPWGDPQRFYSTLLLRPSEATNSPEVQSHMSCDSCAK